MQEALIRCGHTAARASSLQQACLLLLGSRVTGGLQAMIRKLTSGGYRLYSRKKDPRTGKRRNLGTFSTRAAAEKHERAVQYFKRH
jgi:hypothetical protein